MKRSYQFPIQLSIKSSIQFPIQFPIQFFLMVIIFSFLTLSFSLGLSGCGFQIRTLKPIPKDFQVLRILPVNSYDPLQRTLRQHLKMAGISIIEDPSGSCKVSNLTILSHGFTERTTAFGPDVQVNRASLQLTMVYQVTSPEGRFLIPPSTIQVEREITINPNAILGTEFERKRIREELYEDATTQLIRQLSVTEEVVVQNANPG